MDYEVKVKAYSRGPWGQRLASVEWVFPRIVLAETATHRAAVRGGVYEEARWTEPTTPEDAAKSSASSRAIPYEALKAMTAENPYVPRVWGKRGPGMQDAGPLEPEQADMVTAAWLRLFKQAQDAADEMHRLGVHKQEANRALEPWGWVRQVVTMSFGGPTGGWDNFFAIRTHHMAAPAFRLLARAAWLAISRSTPDELREGEWHLPYVSTRELRLHGSDVCLRVSAARCAWTSYGAPGGEMDDPAANMAKALATFQKLAGSFPVHSGPMEHQGSPVAPDFFDSRPLLRSNLAGWLQFRKTVPQETCRDFRASSEEERAWADECEGVRIEPYSGRD